MAWNPNLPCWDKQQFKHKLNKLNKLKHGDNDIVNFDFVGVLHQPSMFWGCMCISV